MMRYIPRDKRAFRRRVKNTECSRQAGLSLIELLIATALSVIIIAAVTTLFVDVGRANREMAQTNSQIENARFAMQFLENDIAHAGFWGGFIPEFDDLTSLGAPGDFPGGQPAPCATYADWDDNSDGVVDSADSELVNRIGIAIQVYDGVPAGCGAIVQQKEPDTDVLVVRHVNTCAAGDANCEALVSGKLYFQVSNCDTEIDSGNFYSLDPNSPLTEMDCTTPVGLSKFMQTIYYVRNYAVTNGDGIPTLVRSEFDLTAGSLQQGPAQALVEGIERFRVELGVDLTSDALIVLDPNDFSEPIDWADADERYSPRNRGDGVADSDFVRCGSTGCSILQLANTVAVRLYILARANEPSPGYVDTKTYAMGSTVGSAVAASALPAGTGFKRHVFTGTVRINNIAGRRETPP